jgi:TRAP-type C4-dicarboxylate transport system substrate-binding protein
VQKHIALTGHIVDHLNTVISKGLWAKLSDEDKKIFTEVALEAASRATAEIQAKEKELVGFFKEKGLTVTEVDTDDFKNTVLKNVTFESFGYRKADWDKIQAVKPSRIVMAGLVPAISDRRRSSHRDHRDKPGDDNDGPCL